MRQRPRFAETCRPEGARPLPGTSVPGKRPIARLRPEGGRTELDHEHPSAFRAETTIGKPAHQGLKALATIARPPGETRALPSDRLTGMPRSSAAIRASIHARVVLWHATTFWLLIGGVLGCKKETPPPAIPSGDYIKPDAPPTYVRPRGSGDDALTFSDITREAGIEFTHVTGAFGSKWMPETIGGGGAFFDYDGDRLPDILLVNSNYWPGHELPAPRPISKLYRNKGDGTFADVTEASGLAAFVCYGMGACVADYDADGDNDVYITALGKNCLLRNDAGRFVDVTDAAGVGFSNSGGPASAWEWSTGATWVDHDRDGDLDLFVCNYVHWTPETNVWKTIGAARTYSTPNQYPGASCVLYRNNGDGTFADVSKDAGIYNPKGKSMSVVADDFDDDGWCDLFVTNDTQPNFLYMNRKDGTFVETALAAGVAYDEAGLARAGMGVGIADVNNMGSRSIAIGNFSGEAVSLYTQEAAQTFIDKAGPTRLSKPTSVPLTFGVHFADFNLDGFEDLILANGHIEPEIETVKEDWEFAQIPQLFLNNRAGQFVEITSKAGAPFQSKMVARCVAVSDIDGDGDLDALLTANGGQPKLLRNDLAEGAHAVRVRLFGDEINVAAIGAALRARAGDSTQSRMIRTGGSYLSQSELVATFGLGAADKIDRLEVRWPDGSTDFVEGLASGATYDIHKGAGVKDRTAFKPSAVGQPVAAATSP